MGFMSDWQTEQRARFLQDPSVVHDIVLNGARVRLPGETIATMAHCLTQDGELNVERAHIDMMTERCGASGSVFIDVGAATGAATLPIAERYGDRVSIIAFEPARNALSLFTKTLLENKFDWVDVRSQAVSDAVSLAEFSELPHDDATPFLPEASSLASMNNSPYRVEKYPVSVTRLDVALRHVTGPSVMKIDIEGFEDRALRGGLTWIGQVRPHIFIDIHARLDGDGDTDPDCRALLEPLDYRLSRSGHVMICEPS